MSAFNLGKVFKGEMNIDEWETVVMASANKQAAMSKALGHGLLTDRNFRIGQGKTKALSRLLCMSRTMSRNTLFRVEDVFNERGCFLFMYGREVLIREVWSSMTSLYASTR
jgi:hypothetical protein